MPSARSSQSQLRACERLRILRVGHDGAGPSPSRANSAMRPSAVARPSSGSGCDVKNCHGVDAAHSSPMNSIGVNGEQHRQHGGDREAAVVEGLRQPVAGGAVADLVVVLAEGRRAASVGMRGSIGWPWSRPRNDDHVPSWKKPCGRDLGERGERGEVGVVAGRLAGHARRAPRGGSRRSTARRGRSRRPRARVMSVGSLRSDSAISVSGRPTMRAQRVGLPRRAPAGCAGATSRRARARHRAAARRRGSRASTSARCR